MEGLVILVTTGILGVIRTAPDKACWSMTLPFVLLLARIKQN